MTDYLKSIENIASGVVAANAEEIDRARVFPTASIDALREAARTSRYSGTHSVRSPPVQQQRATLGQISPVAFEKVAAHHGSKPHR